MSCAGSPGLARAFSANRQWADTSSTALEQSAVVISEHYLPPTVINYLSAHCLSPRHSSRRSFYFSARCLSISCFFCFHLLSLNTLSLFLPPSLTVYPPPRPPSIPLDFCVSCEDTHHVNMRQTSVLMRITTWLNMAECVL